VGAFAMEVAVGEPPFFLSPGLMFRNTGFDLQRVPPGILDPNEPTRTVCVGKNGTKLNCRRKFYDS
jgi:hypothetical protein